MIPDVDPEKPCGGLPCLSEHWRLVSGACAPLLLVNGLAIGLV